MTLLPATRAPLRSVAPVPDERAVPARAAPAQPAATQRAWLDDLRRISGLHAELAAATRAFAENLERHLAAGAHPSLMSGMVQPATATNPTPPELLTPAQLAALLQIHPRTLRRMRAGGQVPPPIKVGDAERWRRTTIERWIAEREERAK